MFTDTLCAVVTIIMAVIIAVGVKEYVCKYRKIKEILNSDDQDTVE